METRKKYTKPLLSSPNGGPHLFPAIVGAAAALTAGYSAASTLKKSFGRSNDARCLALRKVTA